MKRIIIREYNAIRNAMDSSLLSIGIYEEKILYNGQEIIDLKKIEKVFKLIEQNMERIRTISEKKVHNSKGGRQKMISITYEDNNYYIIGNTNDVESKQLYENIFKDVINILEEQLKSVNVSKKAFTFFYMLEKDLELLR